MRRLALFIFIPLLVSAAQPSYAVSDQVANSCRISGYKMAVIGATSLSFLYTGLAAIWAGANTGLPSEVASVNLEQKGRAETISGVSWAVVGVAGLAALTGGSLTVIALHDTWFPEMHHNHCRGFVGFREYFLPFLYLVLGGFQTWAGVEINNLKKALAPQTTSTLAGITTKMFWVTTGFVITGFVTSAFVPVFGGSLTKHHPLGRGESGLGH